MPKEGHVSQKWDFSSIIKNQCMEHCWKLQQHKDVKLTQLSFFLERLYLKFLGKRGPNGPRMRLFRFYQNLVHGTCPIFWEKNFVLKFWGQKVAKNEVYLVLSKVDAWNFSDLLHHVAAAWRLKIYIETKIKTLIKTKIFHWCFRIELAQNELFEYYDKSIHWILSIFSKNLWQKTFWQIVLGFIGQIKKKLVQNQVF